MIIALGFIVAGLLFSALFSGAETGFYRVPRVRLVLDGVDGSWIARGLLWLTNYPGVFVSSVLVGNNIANYAISLGVILLATSWFDSGNTVAGMVMTLAISPMVFILSELLPKSFFYAAPYYLLRVCSLPILFLFLLLAPISFLMFLISRVFQSLLGETPLKIPPALARRELKQVLQEGEEAGLLLGIQRDIAQNIFAYGGNPISQYCMPLRGLKTISSDATLAEIKSAASKSTQSLVAVLHPRTHRLVGYYRVSDILVNLEKPRLRAPITLKSDAKQAVALSELVRNDCDLARVIDHRSEMVGVVLTKRLIGQMLQQS